MVFYRPPLSASRGLNTLSGPVRDPQDRLQLPRDGDRPAARHHGRLDRHGRGPALASRRAVAQAIYSPRFSEGKAVSTAGVTFTSEWYQEYDPETAPAGRDADLRRRPSRRHRAADPAPEPRPSHRSGAGSLSGGGSAAGGAAGGGSSGGLSSRRLSLAAGGAVFLAAVAAAGALAPGARRLLPTAPAALRAAPAATPAAGFPRRAAAAAPIPGRSARRRPWRRRRASRAGSRSRAAPCSRACAPSRGRSR